MNFGERRLTITEELSYSAVTTMIQSKLQAKKAFCFDSMTSISVKTPFLITQDTGKFRVLLLPLRTDS